MTRFILSCTKTGRWWRYSSVGQRRQAARLYGLLDYTIETEERK